MNSRAPSFAPPPAYSRIRTVKSIDELVSTPFGGGVNAFCWQRSLPGDFSEIVKLLDADAGITTLDDARLLSLPLSDAGRIARDILLQDQALLLAHELAPALECIRGYLHDEGSGPVPTHVQSFHVDSATVEADTYLCTYCGPSSEGLRNDEAQRRVDIPETRAKLLEIFGGPDDDDFLEYLKENHYDLHFAPLPHARPFSLGVGNLWRLACEYPGSPVSPCIHRAPATLPGQPPRLLLIA